jgi:hypothetical protein
MRRKPTIIAVAGLCVLAACGPKPAGGATGAGASNATATATAGAPGAGAGPSGGDQVVNFSDLPRPRAGLWQEVLDDGDGSPDTSTTCLSGKAPTVKMPQGCSQFTIKHTILGAYVMDMNCATPQFSMVSHGQMQGDFQSSITSDMTMTMTVPGQPARTTKMHSVFRYMGPCAPGQTPDDEDISNATG